MQDILVLTAIPAPTAALVYAASLAKYFDAAVTGLHVCEPIVLPVDTSLTAAAGLVVAWAQERLTRARAASVEFSRWARRADIERSSWLVAQGPMLETVAFAGNWHDLLVVERDDSAGWGTINALGQLILKAQLPVVVLPNLHNLPAALDCIAVAWNGSPESTRALHASLPLLRRARRILLLSGQRRAPFSPVIEPPAFDVGNYLECHKLNFEQCLLERPSEHSGTEILELAASMRADLLVMGGYGRSRFSEWVLGGATRHVLREARIPVLLRH